MRSESTSSVARSRSSLAWIQLGFNWEAREGSLRPHLGIQESPTTSANL